MKERTKVRMGNRGFSLVELIIVIVIMAALIAILAMLRNPESQPMKRLPTNF